MKSRARFKFNSGMGALLCSACSGIIKVGYEYTEDEKLAEKGLKYLPPQYCDKCSKKLNKK